MIPTIKDLQDSMHLFFSLDPLPRKIKITSAFSAYLDTVCETVFEEPQNEFARAAGVTGCWEGIPIEIDDTIKDEYYEIVYDNDSYLHKFIETNIEPISTLDFRFEWDGPKTKYDYLFMNKENDNV